MMELGESYDPIVYDGEGIMGRQDVYTAIVVRGAYLGTFIPGVTISFYSTALSKDSASASPAVFS